MTENQTCGNCQHSGEMSNPPSNMPEAMGAPMFTNFYCHRPLFHGGGAERVSQEGWCKGWIKNDSKLVEEDVDG